MKRKLACLLVCVMTLGLLAACGQKTSNHSVISVGLPGLDVGNLGGDVAGGIQDVDLDALGFRLGLDGLFHRGLELVPHGHGVADPPESRIVK